MSDDVCGLILDLKTFGGKELEDKIRKASQWLQHAKMTELEGKVLTVILREVEKKNKSEIETRALELVFALIFMIGSFMGGFLIGHVVSWNAAKTIGYEQGYKEGLKHVE